MRRFSSVHLDVNNKISIGRDLKVYVAYPQDIWWCFPPYLRGLYHKIISIN
jgi:hypothetical protein